MPKKPTEFDFSLLTPPWLDFKKKSNLPKGEITSPDAPWLNKK